MKDLVALVADKNTEFGLREVLARHVDLGIRPIAADILVHPERDPGCLLRSHDFLRPFHREYTRALVIFDRDGCGQEHQSAVDLARRVEERLTGSGWLDRAGVVVIDPELEVWVWADSPHVDRVLGWAGRVPNLRAWLVEAGRLDAATAIKPRRPKEAVEEALRIVRKPRSSAIYADLAQAVAFAGCVDPAFRRLCDLLRSWFPANRK